MKSPGSAQSQTAALNRCYVIFQTVKKRLPFITCFYVANYTHGLTQLWISSLRPSLIAWRWVGLETEWRVLSLSVSDSPYLLLPSVVGPILVQNLVFFCSGFRTPLSPLPISLEFCTSERLCYAILIFPWYRHLYFLWLSAPRKSNQFFLLIQWIYQGPI